MMSVQLILMMIATMVEDEMNKDMVSSDNEDDLCHQAEIPTVSPVTVKPISISVSTPKQPQPMYAQARSDEYQLKTDLAKSVAKVLINEDDLELIRQLDKHRVHWKTYALKNGDNMQTRSTFMYNNYKTALAQVQTKVLAAHDPLKKSMKDWDETFFLTNQQKLPEIEDYKESQVYATFKRLCRCKELLTHWKITLCT